MPASARDASKLPKELQEGSVFDAKYKVECILGKGGMGVVVLAHDLVLRREVAVKVLLPEHVAEKEIVERFLREGRAVALIQGEHVCRVLDVSQSKSGLPYMVLEWLVGRNLDEICREEGPMPPHRAVDYVLQACEAVAQAHARGIVHRDIKPSNLFLTHGADGEPLVKVIDFGISKMNDEETREGESLTKSGVMLGSPQYMSPEQMKSSRGVDARADIWSFGAVLFRLTVGHPPFMAASVAEIFASVLHDPPPLASSLCPDVPQGLDDAIRRCLEKDPEKRFQTLEELATAIAPFASSTDHGARSAGRIKAIRERGASYSDADVAEATTVDPSTDDATTAEPSRPVSLIELATRAPAVERPAVPHSPTSSPTFVIAPNSGEYESVAQATTKRSPLAVAAAVAVLVLAGGGTAYYALAPTPTPTPTPTSTSTSTSTATPTPTTTSTSTATSTPTPTSTATATPTPTPTNPDPPAVATTPSAPPSSTAAKPPPKRPPQPPKNQTTTSDRHG